MAFGQKLIGTIRERLNLQDYRKIHWEGTFAEYLDIVRQHPEVTRSAFQRLYDMIVSHGTEVLYENKEKIIRYKFFTEWASRYGDAIYGLERPLMALVNVFKSAARGYGTERRVLLLHGPVGSSKSTIARLLKRGLEEYSRTDQGMLFSFAWKMDDGTYEKCPMHEEPLHLVPHEMRADVVALLNEGRRDDEYHVTIRGDLCPFCRQMYNERLARYNGDWSHMIQDVKVYRLLLSEQDRVGIGTFQPKDEKNQDSTELTGDINYRKIARKAGTTACLESGHAHPGGDCSPSRHGDRYLGGLPCVCGLVEPAAPGGVRHVPSGPRRPRTGRALMSATFCARRQRLETGRTFTRQRRTSTVTGIKTPCGSSSR